MTMASKILDIVRETARGLHEAGVMDTRTMREFDALCLQPVKGTRISQPWSWRRCPFWPSCR